MINHNQDPALQPQSAERQGFLHTSKQRLLAAGLAVMVAAGVGEAKTGVAQDAFKDIKDEYTYVDNPYQYEVPYGWPIEHERQKISVADLEERKQKDAKEVSEGEERFNNAFSFITNLDPQSVGQIDKSKTEQFAKDLLWNLSTIRESLLDMSTKEMREYYDLLVPPTTQKAISKTGITFGEKQADPNKYPDRMGEVVKDGEKVKILWPEPYSNPEGTGVAYTPYIEPDSYFEDLEKRRENFRESAHERVMEIAEDVAAERIETLLEKHPELEKHFKHDADDNYSNLDELSRLNSILDDRKWEAYRKKHPAKSSKGNPEGPPSKSDVTKDKSPEKHSDQDRVYTPGYAPGNSGDPNSQNIDPTPQG